MMISKQRLELIDSVRRVVLLRRWWRMYRLRWHLMVRLVGLVILVLAFCTPPWFVSSADGVSMLGEEGKVAEPEIYLPKQVSDIRTTIMAHFDYHMSGLSRAHLPREPYVRPAFATRMEALRPTILDAAQRHNHPAISGMSDTEFASVIALLLYNEHNGWLEDEFEPLRLFTPLYQSLQVHLNRSGVGSNFSVWPANLRPSVALEIVRQEVPVPEPTGVMTSAIVVAGSTIVPEEYASSNELMAAITTEICQDELAVAYLAANLERGLYRAEYEQVAVDWRVLAAWHNQGIVRAEQIEDNPYAQTYIRRARAYMPIAHALINGEQYEDEMEQRTRKHDYMTKQ